MNKHSVSDKPGDKSGGKASDRVIVKLPPGYTDDDLRGMLGRRWREYTLCRLSLDKRDVNNIFYVAQFERGYAKYTPPVFPQMRGGNGNRVVVVGAGPAGLFAALVLAYSGAKPLILERGGDIDTRAAKVAAFRNCGGGGGGYTNPADTAGLADTANANTTANPADTSAADVFDSECNVCYGEGGAGAFSDGKLNTGIKSEYIGFILQTFVKYGASADILYLAKPHVGTNRLAAVIRGIRGEIEKRGGRFVFGAKLTDIVTQNGAVTAVQYDCGGNGNGNGGGTVTAEAARVILATGHSAKDIYALLKTKAYTADTSAAVAGCFAAKDFSVGVRVEHLRADINSTLHGAFADKLPAADYKYSVRVGERGVYTFCMCPGGVVVNSSTDTDGVCVNGMSDYARGADNSNAAVLVSVSAREVGGIGGVGSVGNGAFAALDFLTGIERRAYTAAGGSLAVPVATLGGFLHGGGLDSFGKV